MVKLTESLSILEQGPSAARSKVHVYTVHTEGMVPGGAVFARDAIVRLTGNPDSAYKIHAWKRGMRTLFEFESEGE